MAQTIKIKRSSTSGNKLTSSNSVAGELGLNTADKALYIQTGSTNGDVVTIAHESTLKIDEVNGRIGIGTTSPSEKLTVNGNISVSGTITTSGNIVVNSNSALLAARKIAARDTNGLAIATSDGTERIGILNSGAVRFNNAFTFPTAIGSAGQVLKVPTSGTTLYWANEAAVSAGTSLSDADGDTKIQVEETADEDRIRFDTAGTQRMVVDSTGLTIGSATDTTTLEFPDKTGIPDSPTETNDKVQLIKMGQGGNGGMWQTTGRGGMLISSADDSLVLANGDAGRFYDPNAGGHHPAVANETLALLSDFDIRFTTGLQDGWSGGSTYSPKTSVITAEGRFGIGTTSPDTNLDITSGGVQGLLLNQDSSDSSASSRIFLKSAQRINTILNVSGNTEFRTGATIGSSSGTVRFAINGSTGNVGIGTTSPGRKLTVQGASGDNLPVRIIGGSGTSHGSVEFQDPNTTADYKVAVGSKGDDFYIQAGGGEKVRVKSDGNVGINTTSPEAKLHNIGHSRLDGAMLQKSNLSIGSGNISTGNEYISHNGPILTNGSTGNINQYGYFRGYQAVYGTDGTNGYNPYAQGSYSNPVFEFISNNRGSISLPTDAAIRNGYLYQFVLGNSGSGGTNSGVELTSSNTTLLWGITSSNHAYFANRVGIGASTPGYKLEVLDSDGGTLANFRDTDSSHNGIIIAGDINAGWVGNDPLATGEGIYYQNSLNAMRFYTNSAERMRIDSSGQVGIGTTTPGARLEIKGTTSDSSAEALNVRDSSNNQLFRVQNDGVVVIGDNYLYVSAGAGAYFDGTVRFRNGITDDTGQLSLNSSTGDITFNSCDLESVGNITTSGYLRGPSTFTIDPATHGDDTGTVVIAGNLQVDGTTTTINSTTLTVDDLNITLASGAVNAAAANGAGITVDTAGAQLTYDATQDRWNMNKGLELIGTPLVVGTGATDIGRVESSSGVFSLTAYTTREIAFGNDTNGEHVRIDTDGNVGIGETDPVSPLHINALSDTNYYTVTRSNGLTVVGANRDLDTDSAGNIDIIGTSRSSAVGGNVGKGPSITFSQNVSEFVDGYEQVIGGIKTELLGTDTNTHANSAMRFYTSTGIGASTSLNERMAILNDGSVGIGQSLPSAKLHVKDASFPQLKLEDADDTMEIGYSGTNFYFKRNDNDGSITFRRADNSDVMSVAMSTKRVGIGTASPTYGLQVVNNQTSQSATGTMYVQASLNGSGKGLVIDSNTRTTSDNSVAALETITRANTTGLKVQVDGNVGIGTSDPLAKLQVEALGIDTTTTTTSATTEATIDSFAAATFRSARYTIQVTNTTDSTYHMTEILLIHNGTTPNITEYGTVFTGTAAEATFDADISSGSVRLRATPASADSMTFKVVRHCITV